jgi:hypothetical protein
MFACRDPEQSFVPKPALSQVWSVSASHGSIEHHGKWRREAAMEELNIGDCRSDRTDSLEQAWLYAVKNQICHVLRVWSIR